MIAAKDKKSEEAPTSSQSVGESKQQQFAANAGLHSASTSSVGTFGASKRRQSMAVAREDVAANIFNRKATAKEKVVKVKAKKQKPELYDQFNTMSWRTEQQKDALKTTVLFGKKPSKWTLAWFEVSSWFIPGIIGFLTACTGAWIEICVEVMADWRFGMCTTNWRFNRHECCNGHENVDNRNNQCIDGKESDWQSWATLTGFRSHGWVEEYIIYIVLGLVYCVVAACLVRFFAPTARGSGIPEVKTILGGFCMNHVLSGRTLVIKIIGLCFVVSSGMSLGKEGPLVHVACCWATLCVHLHDRYVENEGKRRELLSAAAAAGVSVAFGSPLGGVLFSLEEVSTFFPQKTMWRAFFSAVIAAVTLQWLDPTGTGKMTLFEVRYEDPLAFIEYIPFAILGCIGGMVGALFVFLNVRVSTIRMTDAYKARVPIVAEVALIGLLTFASSYPFTFLRPLSSEVIHKLFARCEEAVDNELCVGHEPVLSTEVFVALSVAAVIRFLQTVITFGTGVPAGLFVPSLFTGACIGRLMGSCLKVFNEHYYQFTPDGYVIQPGVYAMVGAASVLGGVCRVTISLVVIMFELTGAIQYIVPFMFAVLLSKWVGDYFTMGIYDCHIVLRGYPYLHEPEEITYTSRVCDVMEDQLEALHVQKNTVGDLLDFMADLPFYGFPLIRSPTDNILLGFICREELEEFLRDKLKETFVTRKTECFYSMHSPKYILDGCRGKAIDLSDLVDDTVMRLVPETPLTQVHNVFRQLGLRMIMVVRHGRLQGMITKKHFVYHLHSGHVGNIKADPSHFSDELAKKESPQRRFSYNELLPETDMTQPLLGMRRSTAQPGIRTLPTTAFSRRSP
eukprot:GEMP01003974.1.p1 GENE.GEMP01003974.1~~GEMP01003974.1.p1  ORF type:complete len:848 (-),score=152.16 GEMP01003974.1:1726-4269(-)